METGPRLEVDCQLQFPEFYHALRWHAWRKFWKVYCALIFGVFAFGMVQVLHSISDSSFNVFKAILYCVGFPALLGCVFYYSVYRYAQLQFKTGSSFREMRHYLFCEDGIESSASVSSGRSAWTVLFKVIETPESILFFTSIVVFTILPKRTLETEDRVQVLRNLIRQKVGAKAELLKY